MKIQLKGAVKSALTVFFVLPVILPCLSFAAKPIAPVAVELELYGEWTTRFGICSPYYHEDEASLFQYYDSMVNSIIAVDFNQQMGRASNAPMPDSSTDPKINEYLSEIDKLIQVGEKRGKALQASDPGRCAEAEEQLGVHVRKLEKSFKQDGFD